ncbi:hypothetical protein ACTXT7_002269 [Hymenolepis weldensis]
MGSIYKTKMSYEKLVFTKKQSIKPSPLPVVAIARKPIYLADLRSLLSQAPHLRLPYSVKGCAYSLSLSQLPKSHAEPLSVMLFTKSNTQTLKFPSSPHPHALVSFLTLPAPEDIRLKSDSIAPSPLSLLLLLKLNFASSSGSLKSSFSLSGNRLELLQNQDS